MSDEFLSLDGLVVPPGGLTVPRAGGLAAAAAGELSFVTLIECRTRTGAGAAETIETVVIEVDVERPQQPVNDIRRTERIAVVFSSRDDSYPECLSLRPDFPRVPHINLRDAEFPRSLCLYDRSWPEVALRWTPALYIQRIRYWLAQTARGTLHGADQPLEPLLFGGGLRIVLPADVLTDLDVAGPVPLEVRTASSAKDCTMLVATRPRSDPGEQDAPRFVATTFAAAPLSHGLIRHSPANLAELHDFLAAGGIDLLGSLRARVKEWNTPRLVEAALIILVGLPLVREPGTAPERWDFWAFATVTPLRQVGAAIGVWADQDGEIGFLLTPNEDLKGQTVPVEVIAPVHAFSREVAAAASGEAADACKVVAIGAGALGSQVLALLGRAGFGSWTIVDNDDLMPHNLARHALHGMYVGRPKALSMAFFLNQFYRDGGEAKPIVANVLSACAESETLRSAFADADLILDMAASVPVARHIASAVESSARRISVFLNPNGTDLVVLAEDRERSCRLDALEMQYYAAVASDSRLLNHLADNSGRLRYGRSCRDVTMTMPNHLVALHAAIASKAIRRAQDKDGASITVFRCDPDTLAVTPVEVVATPPVIDVLSDWTLVVDSRLLVRLAELRQAKLPKETGGVLIGTHDFPRRTVFVVDTVPSPPDSKEWPNLYIRGSAGLLDAVTNISNVTRGELEYVGEWHSHPDGCATLPSKDDLKGFVWLTERMGESGHPALIAIVGEGPSSSWYLGRMSSTGEERVKVGIDPEKIHA